MSSRFRVLWLLALVSFLARPAAFAQATGFRTEGDYLISTFARPVDRMELYSSGNNGSTVCVNGREVMKDINRNGFKKGRAQVKEGDVIAIQQLGRFSDNFIWLSALSPSNEFLFETSLEWKCYLPKDPKKWWDIKGAKAEQPVEFAPEKGEYQQLVKNAAMSTPLFRGTLPIHCLLKEPGDQHQNFYFYHVITKFDLLPKKFATAGMQADLSAAWLGKLVRIRPVKDGAPLLLMEQNEAKIGRTNPASPETSTFKITRGSRPGSIFLESQARPGAYLRHAGGRLAVDKLIANESEFWLQKPVAGSAGHSLAPLGHPQSHLVIDGREAISFSDQVKDESAVFFLEEVKSK